MIFYWKDETNDKAYWLNEKDEFVVTRFLDMPFNQSFEMFDGYNRTEVDLRRFKRELIGWADEMKKGGFKFLEKRNNRRGIWDYFLSKATNVLKSFDIENIQAYEYEFIEDCPNGGLNYFNTEYKDIPTQCYGYDEKMFYPNLLCDKMLRVPNKKGVLKKLVEIPATFEYGIYKCKVVCDDPNMLKLFAFSKKNTYTSISLNNALYLKNQKKMNITLELNQTETNNALIYEETKDAYAVFNPWLKAVKRLRESNPKNKLFKYLSSSLWGELVRFNQKLVTDFTEIDLDDYIVHDHKLYPERQFISLLPKDQPYKSNLARLKPFLVALSRYHMCNIILKHKIMNNIIRIQTDGIVLNKEVEFKGDYAPLPEDKTTGMITWYNVNKNDRIKEKNEMKEKLKPYIFLTDFLYNWRVD